MNVGEPFVTSSYKKEATYLHYLVFFRMKREGKSFYEKDVHFIYLVAWPLSDLIQVQFQLKVVQISCKDRFFRPSMNFGIL